jgi:hypothetical protein
LPSGTLGTLMRRRCGEESSEISVPTRLQVITGLAGGGVRRETRSQSAGSVIVTIRPTASHPVRSDLSGAFTGPFCRKRAPVGSRCPCGQWPCG